MTSVIWKWFEYLKSVETQIKTVCKIYRQSVPTKTGNATNVFCHLKRYHPSDHTKSMKMWAHVSPPTSFVQRPCGSSAVGNASRVVPKQQLIVSKKFDVIVVTALSFIYIVLIGYEAS